MFERSFLTSDSTKVLVALAAALAVVFPFSATPSLAVDETTTNVVVNLEGITESGDSVPVEANVLNLQVFEGNESIYDANAYAGNGCTDDETHECSVDDWSSALSGTIVFAGVPVSSTAKYYVQYDYVAGDNTGTFDRFLKIGEVSGLPNYSAIYSGLSTTWNGMSENPAPFTLTLHFADSGSGSVEGTLYRKDNYNSVGLATIGISGSFSISGEEYSLRTRTYANENGHYQLGGLPIGSSLDASFEGWDDQSDNNPFYVNNSDLMWGGDEHFSISAGNPHRVVNLFAPKSRTEQPFPTGDTVFQGLILDQQGNPVESGIEYSYTLTSSTGATREETGTTPDIYIDGLVDGDYQMTVSAEKVFPAATTQVSLSGNSDTHDISVITYPTGNATITGKLDIIGETVTPDEPSLYLSIISFADSELGPDIDISDFGREIERDNITGNWEVRNLPDGRYKVQVNSPNWTGRATWSLIPPFIVNIVNGESVDTGLKTIRQLVPSEDVLNVKVKDSVTRVGVPGATCSAYIYSDEMWTAVQAKTDESGIATLSGLFRGSTYNMMCRGSGAFSLTSVRHNAVQIHEGINNVIMSLDQQDPTSTVRGRIVDSDGNPLSGIRIFVGQTLHQIPDCEDCTADGGTSYSDLTYEDGGFELGPVLPGHETIVRVEDPRGELAKKTLRIISTGVGNFDIGNIEINRGATLTGNVTTIDQVFGRRDLTLIESGTDWGNRANAQIGNSGDIAFAEPTASGAYNAFVAISNDANGSDSYARGWIGNDGNLTASKVDARVYYIDELTSELGSYTFGEGSTISGSVRFTDNSGNELTSWTYFARVKLYVHNSDGDWEYTGKLSSHIGGGSGSSYSLKGLPDGEYKVCFTDPEEASNRYELVCNGGAESLDSAEPIVLESGDVVSGVDATITFRQPDAAPQPVSLNELDDETYQALEDQIAVLSRDAGATVLQVDPDFAGQWVAAEVIPEGSTTPSLVSTLQTGQSSSFNNIFNRVLSISVTSWLQVNADGEVTIPNNMLAADETGQIALLGPESNVIGWTDLTASGSEGNSGGSGSNGSTDTTDTTVDDVLEGTAPVPLTADSDATGGSKAATGNLENDYGFTTDPWLLPLLGSVLVAIIATGVGVARARSRDHG